MKKLIVSAIALYAIISITSIDAGVQLNHSIKYTCEVAGNKSVVEENFFTPATGEYFSLTQKLIDKAREHAKQKCEDQNGTLIEVLQIGDALITEKG